MVADELNEFDIAKINEMCKNKSLRWTNHIVARLVQRGISMDDVEGALFNGEIIELYPDDYPYPSCLVLGKSETNESLHIVCGVSDVDLWLITAYYPDNEDWEPDFKARRGSLK